jgi:hypothetical protein
MDSILNFYIFFIRWIQIHINFSVKVRWATLYTEDVIVYCLSTQARKIINAFHRLTNINYNAFHQSFQYQWHFVSLSNPIRINYYEWLFWQTFKVNTFTRSRGLSGRRLPSSYYNSDTLVRSSARLNVIIICLALIIPATFYTLISVFVHFFSLYTPPRETVK